MIGVDKVSWQQAGRVTEPGRYMFRFGWLTVAAKDLAIWERFPGAAFTLVRTAADDDEREFHLGAFELGDFEPDASEVPESNLSPAEH
jgi:hypothetical protein